MAIVMRGKNKGKAIKLHQFCNDWATSEESEVFNITSLEFSQEEIDRINRANELKQYGMMFQSFRWKENRLTRI